MRTDELMMWARTCPCCGATEYTDETCGGEPRSLGGSCPECATVHESVWRVADEPHPAVWG